MSISLMGRKIGMTRLFDEVGSSVPVTVVLLEPNKVSQIKGLESDGCKDGYRALQLAVGKKRASRVNNAQVKHFIKAGLPVAQRVRESRVEALEDYKLGDELGVSHFEVGQCVDVSGVSKGKGFSGTIKRHNFKGKDATHGNSLSHRTPGSIGQNQTPGRVFPGKKMSGQMGSVNVTVQNLEVVSVDQDKNLILIKGAVPGPAGSSVYIKHSVKA